MNYVLLTTIMLLSLSCTRTEAPEEELTATNFGYYHFQEPQYLNGAELYKLGTIQSLTVVRQEIAKLKEGIDLNKGSKGEIAKLEMAQKKESALSEYKTGLVSIVMPRGGKFPPRPPRGCFDDPRLGCVPKINISDFNGIEITDGLEGVEVIVVDKKNNVLAKGSSPQKLKDGKTVIMLKGDFSGDATMLIKKTDIRKFGQEIVLQVPVYKE
ncbi:hypothetical protein [Zobellia sp. OII3]|uniref:hypothetical protein n=1 Tax=Zobellia sp. OII3 TaxID=2034520 RepID=UPI0013748214|nr:hypothetical protein [Zobellia sp. OII3]